MLVVQVCKLLAHHQGMAVTTSVPKPQYSVSVLLCWVLQSPLWDQLQNQLNLGLLALLGRGVGVWADENDPVIALQGCHENRASVGRGHDLDGSGDGPVAEVYF